MGEPDCKARITVYDSVLPPELNPLIRNNWTLCKNIDAFSHSRYSVTVHEKVYSQAYLDRQQAIQDKKDEEARKRAEAREQQRILEEQKRIEEEQRLEQERIAQEPIVTPITDIPNIVEKLPNQNIHAIQNKNVPKKDNTNTILMLGGIGLVTFYLLKNK